MMFTRLNAVVATVSLLLLGAACGQKGPLYLPGNPSQIQTDIPRQPSAEPRPADEEENAEDDEQHQNLTTTR